MCVRASHEQLSSRFLERRRRVEAKLKAAAIWPRKLAESWRSESRTQGVATGSKERITGRLPTRPDLFRESSVSHFTYRRPRINLEQPLSDEQRISTFCKNERGEVFHTYSCNGRVLKWATVPVITWILCQRSKGLNEDDFKSPRAWVRRHDHY
jgi:hypothetical protein